MQEVWRCTVALAEAQWRYMIGLVSEIGLRLIFYAYPLAGGSELDLHLT